MEVNTLPQLLLAMQNCYQFENVNMYEHGLMVNREYFNIITALELGIIDEVFPSELIDVYQKSHLLDFSLMVQYHILHDCGKPLCRIVTDEGRVQFPNHADESFQQIRKFFPSETDLQYLVQHDMDFHVLKPDDLKSIAESKYGFSLYLTAWAELIANSQMFGGFDSISFKIKRKKLLKCLKLFK